MNPAQRGLDTLGRGGLGHERERSAREPVLAVVVERDDLHRNVPRLRVLLELAQDVPAQHVRKEDIERNCRRPVFVGERQRFLAAHRDQHLETLIVREIDKNARVVRIVFDDEKDCISRLYVPPIIRYLLNGTFRYRRQRDGARGGQLPAVCGTACHRRADIAAREIERERTSDTRRAAKMDFATEEVRELAADRETQTRAAIFAAGTGISLLERFEDDLLLFGGNADAGIGNLKGDDRGSLAQHGVRTAPAGGHWGNNQADAAALRKLEGVRKQVLEHLLQALGVRHDGAIELRIDLHIETQLSRLRFMAEWPRHGFDEVHE